MSRESEVCVCVCACVRVCVSQCVCVSECVCMYVYGIMYVSLYVIVYFMDVLVSSDHITIKLLHAVHLLFRQPSPTG